MFGAAGTAAAPASTGFGPTAMGAFGSGPATASASPAPFGSPATSAAPSLFGTTGTTPATPSFGTPTLKRSMSNPSLPKFGATNTPTATPQATGPAPAANPSSSTSLFGSTTTAASGTSLFGSAAPSTKAPTLTASSAFGSTTATPAPAFGNPAPPTTNLAFGAQAHPPSTAPTQPGQGHVWDQLMLLKEYWNPQSPLCQFKHYFYNLVDPVQVHLYTCPPDHDPALWDQAQQANPDPTCLVPALAIGFEDLKRRADQQQQEAQAHQVKLAEIGDTLAHLNTKHTVDTVAKIAEFRRRHREQLHRILRLMKLLQVLRYRGQTLRPEEEIMRVRLEALLNELVKPGQLQRKAQDLWAQSQNLLLMQKSRQVYSTPFGHIRYEVTNPTDLENCVNLLDNYQAGLARMTALVQQDLADTQALLARSEQSSV
ncbi:hypothetical protein H4R35_004339 [Dimargaris xerosporica]|nr:hypothetical protein H4R35_004339 [Dimargaris xerosporica]